MVVPGNIRRWTHFSLAVIVLTSVCACGPSDTPHRPEISEPDLVGLDSNTAARLTADRRQVLERVANGALSNDEAGEEVGKLGMVYQANGLDQAAMDCYSYALDVQAAEARWHYLLGRVFFDRGDWREAATHLESAAHQDLQDVPPAFFAGVAFQQLGDTEAALGWFRKVLERDNRCAAAYYRTAQIEAGRQNLETAVKEYLRVLDLQPGATRVHAALAALYRRLGDNEAADAHLALNGDGAVKLTDPVMGEIGLLSLSKNELLNRGGTAFNRKRFAEALVWYRRAAEMAPSDADVRIGLGSALFGLGEIEAARHEFENARSLAPSNSRAYFNLGTLYARTGDDHAAIGEYRTAIAVDPGYTAAHLNLGNALLRGGLFNEAVTHFEAAIRLDRSRPEARLAEVVALSLDGRCDTAAERIEKAHRMFPENPAMSSGLVRILAACPAEGVRNGTRAVEIAEQLIGVSSRLDTVISLAMAYAEVGRFDDAVLVERRALDAVSDNGRTDLEGVLGDRLEAYSNRKPCRDPWVPAEL